MWVKCESEVVECMHSDTHNNPLTATHKKYHAASIYELIYISVHKLHW